MVALRAVEHHHFTIGGCALLFDVNTLAVADSCDLDRALLADAAEGRTASEILERAVAAGWDARGARIRLYVLQELRFLLDTRETPRRMREDVRADCRGCWTRNLCGRSPSDRCESARAETEAAIARWARRS